MTEFNNFNAIQASFFGFVQNGKIYNNLNQQVGVTNEEYQKAINTAKEYEQVLYDKGILEKPKTPEEINRETQNVLKQTQAMVLEMSNALSALNDKVTKLEEKKANVKQANSSQSSEPLFKTGKSGDAKQSV